MATREKVPAHGDPSLPPLFSPEEWRKITCALSLSPRQAQVVGLVMQSHKDKEIGAVLTISKSTVRTHIGDAKARLAATDRMGLAYRVFATFREVIELNGTRH